MSTLCITYLVHQKRRWMREMAELVTIRGAARRFGVHENTVRNWITKGLVIAQLLPSGVRRIPESEVVRIEDALIGQLPTNPAFVDPTPAPKQADQRLSPSHYL